MFKNTYSFSYPLIFSVKRSLKIKTKLTQRDTFHLSWGHWKTIKLMVTSPGTLVIQQWRTLENLTVTESEVLSGFTELKTKQRTCSSCLMCCSQAHSPPTWSGGHGHSSDCRQGSPSTGRRAAQSLDVWDVSSNVDRKNSLVNPPKKEINRKAVNNKHIVIVPFYHLTWVKTWF